MKICYQARCVISTVGEILVRCIAEEISRFDRNGGMDGRMPKSKLLSPDVLCGDCSRVTMWFSGECVPLFGARRSS